MSRWRVATAALGLVAAACSGAQPATAPAPTEAPSPSTTSPSVPAVLPSGSGWAACWSAPVEAVSAGPVRWEDRTERAGLVDPLRGVMGHAVAAGDVNGDGWDDLLVGTFGDRPTRDYQLRGATGPAPDRLLLGGPDGYRPDGSFPELRGRSTGAVLADLDGDGDLDAVLARNVVSRDGGPELRAPTLLLENDGGQLRVAAELDRSRGSRSVGVLDFDRDGRLDLFLVEDRLTGGSSVLLRNDGGLSFTDATDEAGLPPDVAGLGVAVADLTGDGWGDLFVAGSNRLFVNTGGGFAEERSAVFAWDSYGPEDDVAGVAVGDLDRDGWPDLVVGQHYGSTTEDGRRVPVRVYRNRGEGARPGDRFTDVTDAAGVPAFATKAPDVEVADLDNDGWPDVVVTASAEGGTVPTVLRNLGGEGGGLAFSAPGGLGDPQYWVTGVTTDADHDGRLDLFVAEFAPRLPSRLLGNAGPSGHWLAVSVADAVGGVGALVEVYRAGAAGQPEALLARTEIGVTVGYGAGRAARAHVGLGAETSVDLRVTPSGADPVVLPAVGADAAVRVGGAC